MYACVMVSSGYMGVLVFAKLVRCGVYFEIKIVGVFGDE